MAVDIMEAIDRVGRDEVAAALKMLQVGTQSKEFLAYVAGIIDGEGSIQTGGKPTYSQISLSVSNTYKPLISKLHACFGGSMYGYPESKMKGNRRPYYRWCAFGQLARDVLKAVYPYLIVKKRHAEIIFDLCKNINSRDSHPVSSEERVRREILFDEIKSLNYKGIGKR